MEKEFILQLMKTLPHLMHELFHDLKKPDKSWAGEGHQLNKTHRKTLMVLYSEEVLSMTRFCHILNMEKGSFTPVVNRLAESGLIIREQDPSDRRIVNIRLSSKGELMVENSLARAVEHLEAKFASLSEEEVLRFKKAVSDLDGIVKKIQEK